MFFVFFSHGKDRMGRPVAYVLMKRNNKKGWNKDEVVKMMAYQMDKMIRNMEPGCESFSVMYSTQGCGMLDVDMDLFTKMLDLFKLLYPERMEQVLLFPSGRMIKGVVSMVKKLLPARTAEKIIALGNLEEIYEYIDENELIEEVGGKKVFDPTTNLDNDNYETSTIATN